MSQQRHDAVPHASGAARDGASGDARAVPDTGSGPTGDLAVVTDADESGAGNGRSSAAAELINPAAEDAYWRENYLTRPYADGTLSFDHYRPAYRYGWESRARLAGRRWDEVERELGNAWRSHRGTSRLGWADARQAARDAWQRVERWLETQRNENGGTAI